MGKKASIFKMLLEYFKTHPVAVLAWAWVSFMPLLGSLVLVSQYFWVEKISLESFWEHVLLTCSISMFLGLALLPTTLTSLACGFFWGWIGFPDLLLWYVLANGIGFAMGKLFNPDLSTMLFSRNPNLKQQIESRIEHPQGLIFFIRISPMIPFALSNFLFASLGIPLRKVLLFGVPGMLPRTYISFATGMLANSFMGAKEALNHPIQWMILIGLFILSLVGIHLNWEKTKV